jgi:integrase
MIEQRADGKWRVRIWQDGARLDVGVEDTEEAARALETLSYKSRSRKGTTVAKWVEDWLDARELDGVRGIRTERGRWRTHIRGSALGRRPLAELTPADVEAWIDELRAKTTATPHRAARPLSPKTIREIWGLLRQALEDARGKHLGTNPAADARRKLKDTVRRRQALSSTEEPWTFLEIEEQRKILTSKRIPETARTIIAIAIYTGLREGELFSLRLADVKLKASPPHVVVRYGGKDAPTKGGRLRRAHLLPAAVEALSRWLKLLPEWAPSNPLGLLIPTRGGAHVGRGKTPFHRTVWVPSTRKGTSGKAGKTDDFPTYLRAAGIDRHVRWHDLRHTCGSSLASGWWGRMWSAQEVQKHLGHRSLMSTMRYFHLAESAHVAAVEGTPFGAVGLPQAGSKAGRNKGPSAWNRWVGRQGLEPWTYGLKAPDDPEQLQALVAPLGSMAGQLAARARAALAAFEAGDPFAPAMLAALLDEVLSAPDAKREDASGSA